MIADTQARHRGRFRLGINYWPAESAMRWWTTFERSAVAADFKRIAASGFDSIRIFLTWEDFQPTPTSVDSKMVDRLKIALELARDAGLVVMPTLFTGHMSGVNWIPGWATGGTERDDRFRVVAGKRLVSAGLRNWYTDETVIQAQVLLARELASAIAGHEALWAWDLGNENSNCVVPPTRAHGREWLFRLSDAIRAADPDVLVTLGLHMEDLEHDRGLGPAEAAEACDFLTMHGYPGYAAWARGIVDEQLLPFLAHVTRWLGGGAEVLFSEFGAPTYGSGDPRTDASSLVDEEDAARYIGRALDALLESGCTGAMLWCYADYAPAIWTEPPLDAAVHERSFGLWRADASPKPSLAVIESFAKLHARPKAQSFVRAENQTWIDTNPLEFQRDPEFHLPRLYQRYCEANSS